MQPSFIPKTTLSKASFKRPKKAIFFVVSGIILFTISAGLLGGVFLYSDVLKSGIEGLKNELDRIKNEEFEIESINELFKVSNDIKEVRTVLAEHRVPSNLIKLIEDLTLKEVRFSNFSFAGDALSMNGVATSYTTVAKQAVVFETSPSIKESTLANFSLSGESGNVSFSTSITIKSELLRFKTD